MEAGTKMGRTKLKTTIYSILWTIVLVNYIGYGVWYSYQLHVAMPALNLWGEFVAGSTWPISYAAYLFGLDPLFFVPTWLGVTFFSF